MWFLRDETGYTQCCLAHGELAWLFLEPDTGWQFNWLKKQLGGLFGAYLGAYLGAFPV